MAGLASCRDGNIYDTYQKFNLSPEDIRLLGDRLIVKQIPDPESINGIAIPQSAGFIGAGKSGSFRYGVVMAVGPGDICRVRQRENGTRKITPFAERSQPFCKVGDQVIYDRRREAEFNLGGEVYTMLHEEQGIMCILDAN